MKLPETKSTRSEIFKAWESSHNETFRPHLGASVIGKKCSRDIWFSFRWATKPNFSGRILKLFDRGHSEESRFVSDLKMIGCEIKEFDESGNQWRFELFNGHFGGSCDGIIPKGVIEAPKSPHIAEMKTHNEKSFNLLVKDGVEKSKPQHFIQMQTYMGLSGVLFGAKYRIERSLYIAVNKNNDDLYCERIKYDKKIYDATVEKAKNIIFSTSSIDGISSNPSWYECKFCDHYSLCHEKKLPEVNCRTCAHSTAEEDGGWSCRHNYSRLSYDDQLRGCDYHLFSPHMVSTWLTATDGSDESIVFEEKNSFKTWINGIDNITSVQAFNDDKKDYMI